MEPEVHTTDHIAPVAELPIEPFKWKRFSYIDTFKHTVHQCLNFVFCQLLGKHDWLIQVVEWNFNTIDSVEKFRLHCARKLKCSCCQKVIDVDDADLSFIQRIWYDHYTKNYFTYDY